MENSILIYKKIAEILKGIEPVKKDRKNSQQGYSFRGVEDAMNMLSPLFAQAEVFPTIFKIEDIKTESVTSKSGTGGLHCIRRYTFRFYTTDGSYVDTIADGEAIDFGDKATNKCYSVAYREALWKMFIVPFDVDDTENHSPEVVATKAPVSTPEQMTSEKAYNIARGLIENAKKAKDPVKLKSALERITSSKNLSAEQKEELMFLASDEPDPIPNMPEIDYGEEEQEAVVA